MEEATVDIETRCLCGYWRYHRPPEGFWIDGQWWHSRICFERHNMSEKAWAVQHSL
jgi:hypothetical protein